ncbi:MAG: cbb3-type cytochrome c oxidase subunit I [Magnetococcales bacterium]|nr:cbb3-type cytochrome c oxidase subunit I [Magnetococcales bacterium]
MDKTPFTFPTLNPVARGLSLGWLSVAIASLVGSGLVVILVILARAPIIHELIPWIGSFRTALVIHVDLSVLVWFLAFAGVMSAPFLNGKGVGSAGRYAVILGALGTLVITFSPFLGEDRPFRNNYIPVLENAAFFIGLGLFVAGFVVMALHTLVTFRRDLNPESGETALAFGIRSGLVIGLVSILFWIWSAVLIPADIAADVDIREHYYELLFWSGGHVLQFTHTQLLVVAWVVLAAMTGLSFGLKPRTLLIILILGAVPVLAAPVLQLLHPVDSFEHREIFTRLMWWGNGIAPLLIGFLLIGALLKGGSAAPEHRPARRSLIFSLALFGMGGVIGYMIQEINTTIPAHYHGSIIAITMAYMGVAYALMPGLGCTVPWPKLAAWQPVIYFVGQALHIIGLAWGGGHGVQRKTAGAEQALRTTSEKLAMNVMGVGGILAVIGGVLFMVIAIKAIKNRQR